MKAFELEKYSVFSLDGGESWHVVISEPRDGDNDDTVFLASPRDQPGLSNAKEYNLNNYSHVWEPHPDDLNLGKEILRVKEENEIF